MPVLGVIFDPKLTFKLPREYQMITNQRSLKNVELIRMDANNTDYAHNQPLNVALVRTQILESAFRNIFRKNVIMLKVMVFCKTKLLKCKNQLNTVCFQTVSST